MFQHAEVRGATTHILVGLSVAAARCSPPGQLQPGQPTVNRACQDSLALCQASLATQLLLPPAVKLAVQWLALDCACTLDPGALVRPPARPSRVPLSANPPRTHSPTRNLRLNATFNLTRPCGAKLQGTLARAPPQSSRININLAPPNEQGRQHSEAPTPFFRLGLRFQRAVRPRFVSPSPAS